MMPTLRMATLPDLAAMNRLSLASKAHWGYPAEWMEKWKASLLLRESDLLAQQLFLLEAADGPLLGFCSLMESDHQYELLHLWIRPDCIGKGLGKYLLKETLRRVVVKEKPILVEADPHAEGFYARQGFQTIGRRQSYPPDRYIPLMIKRPPYNFA